MTEKAMNLEELMKLRLKNLEGEIQNLEEQISELNSKKSALENEKDKLVFVLDPTATMASILEPKEVRETSKPLKRKPIDREAINAAYENWLNLRKKDTKQDGWKVPGEGMLEEFVASQLEKAGKEIPASLYQELNSLVKEDAKNGKLKIDPNKYEGDRGKTVRYLVA